MRLPFSLLTVAALAFATGCAPTVTLHHTEVRGASLEGVSVVAVLEVENENAFDVEVRRVRARVTLAERYHLAPIDFQPNKWVRAGSKARVSVPVTIGWTTVPGVLAAAGSSSEVTYRVVGTADVTAGRSMKLKRDAYPIDQEGTIPRRSFKQGGLPLPF